MPLLFALFLVVTSELSIQEGKADEFLAIVKVGLEVSPHFSASPTLAPDFAC